MKTFLLPLCFLFLLTSFSANSQSITQRTTKAEFVIEGKVIAQHGFWNEEHTQIYTEHTIKVFKIFKGNVTDETLSIITLGGNVDDSFYDAVHLLKIPNHAEGIFFCQTSAIYSTENNSKQTLQLSDTNNGFVEYFFDDNNPKAADKYQAYKNIDRNVYREIEKQTFTPLRAIALNSREQKQADWEKEYTAGTVNTTSNTEKLIEYSFKNAQINSVTEIQFEIYAAVNSNANGVRLGEAELYLEYNSEAFGQNVVAKNALQINKGLIVQNNIYQISTNDEAPNTLSVNITGGCENPFEAYTLTTTEQKLCTVVLTVEDISQIANISMDDFKMEEQSKYIEPESIICTVFDGVLVDDPLNQIITGDSISIEYELDNIEITGSGPNRFLDFDITAKAGEEGSSFFDAIIYVDYNVDAFGGNINTNNNLFITNGDLNQNLQYDFTVSDWDVNTFRINITAKDSSDLRLLPIDPLQMVHVKIRGLNCDLPAGIEFVEEDMNQNSIHFIGGIFPFEIYEPTIANDKYNQAACSENTPIILDFFPKILAGGIGNVLTITGTNFGEVDFGSVKFNDANKDNTIYNGVVIDDILLWSDTLIEVVVPNAPVAGTGQFIVENLTGLSSLSDEVLEIKYSVINRVSPLDGDLHRTNLINANEEGGYTFFLDSFLFDQPGVVDCIEKALLEWSCATGVTWELEGLTDITDAAFDNVNVIFWDETLGDTILAITYLGGNRITDCGDEDGDIFYYLQEFDIGISSFKTWHWDCKEEVADTSHDFYSVMLHELGHGHLLDHALTEPKVMYPFLATGLRRGLTAPDIEGGLDIMDFGHDHLVGGECEEVGGANDINFPEGCINAVGELEPTHNIQVYPNPFREQILVEINLEIPKPVNLQVFDLMGKQIYFKKVGTTNNGVQRFAIDLLDRSISSGIFFLHISVGEETTTKKIVKF